VFAELVAYGGDRREAALAFAALQTLGLCLLLSFTRWAPAELRGRRTLLPLYLMFAGLVAWAGFQLAPAGSGMARMAWAAAGRSPAVTIDAFATLVELAKLLGLGAFFMTAVIIGGGERRARAAFRTVGIAGAAYVAWAVTGFYLHGWGGVVIRAGRLGASLLSPNTTAAVLGLVALVGWAATLGALRGAIARGGEARGQAAAFARRAWPWIVLIVAALWALALTGSRGGALSTLLGFGVVSAAVAAATARGGGGVGRGLTEMVAAGTGVLVVAVVVALASQGTFASRLRDYQIGLADRIDYLDLYAGHLRDVPWTGFGLGTFARFNPLMLGPSAPSRFWEFGAMHNVYLQWLYEAGIVGSALMFGCVAWAVGIVARGLGRAGAGGRWGAAALGVSAMLAIHGLVDFDLQIHAIAALWALVLGAGVGSALRRPG
jgi:O-antigen ligase